jgi:NTE family protein
MGARVVAAVCACVLVIGCGHSQDVVKPPKARAAIGPAHPLTERLFGARSVSFSFHCASKRMAAENQGPPGSSSRCTPVVGEPYYSLSLSGGGYRATLFHYGAVKRLNDIGRLGQVRMVCGVSGGSIVAATLVHRWKELQFDERGVATNLYDIVGKPIDELTSKTLDKGVAARNVLPAGAVSTTIAPTLDSVIFKGSRLSDLPGDGDSPLLVLGAVNYQTGRPWTFSRDYFGSGPVPAKTNDFLISQAVAASSAFPPVLGPIQFQFEVPPFPAFPNSLAFGIIDGKVLLVDGGVLDNNSLRYCATADVRYVSSASRSQESVIGASNWMSVVSRVVDLIHEESTDSQFRSTCARDGSVCWALRERYRIGSEFGLDEETVDLLGTGAQQPTRFKAMDVDMKCVLSIAGYLAAAESLRDNGGMEGSTDARLLRCDFDPEVRSAAEGDVALGGL